MPTRSLIALGLIGLFGSFAGCGSDDSGSTGTDAATGGDATTEAGGSPTALAESTAACMQDAGYEQALTAEIYLTEANKPVAPEDGYSVLAVAADGSDIQVMIFTDPELAGTYVKDAAADGDNIVREPVAEGRVIVESGFTDENGVDNEAPADAATLAAIETCLGA